MNKLECPKCGNTEFTEEDALVGRAANDKEQDAFGKVMSCECGYQMEVPNPDPDLEEE